MDPSRFPAGYYTGGDGGGDEAADAWAQDFNNPLLTQPEAVIDDPSWYTDFDYSADPSAYHHWDASAGGGGHAETAYETAGPAAPPAPAQQQQQQQQHHQGEAPSSGNAGRKGKGRAQPQQHHHLGHQQQQQQQQQQVEYRFKTDLPDPSDWDTHKNIIKELYLTQKLSLKDVTEIMKDQHDFYATERMYKHQFKKWNWSKYKSKDRK